MWRNENIEIRNSLLTVPRTSSTTLKAAVPILGDYSTLKSQFDWLFDGPVSHLITQNLGPELQDLELFLRYGSKVRYLFVFSRVPYVPMFCVCYIVYKLKFL
jgi:hypothetical protein